MNVTETITEAIITRLQEIKKPKRRLAKECGLTQQGIGNLCSGRAARSSTYDKIFDNLGLEIEVKVKETI